MILYKTELSRADRRPVLIREREIAYGTTRTPEAVGRMLNDVFNHGWQAEEVVYEVCYDAAYKPIGVFEVSRGSATSTCCNPREIFQRALLCGAVNIIIAHNHPSGDPTPSMEDKQTAKRLGKAGKMIGVELTDFLIVTDAGAWSILL